jgi:anti-sigma B factor antagonist
MAVLTITADGHGFAMDGELDMATAPELAAAFADVLHSDGPVTVDMRALRFMDLSGIHVIVDAARTAPERCIILHGVHDEVQRVVEVTGIEQEVPHLHVMPCSIGLPS